jgi:hypothetical protein
VDGRFDAEHGGSWRPAARAFSVGREAPQVSALITLDSIALGSRRMKSPSLSCIGVAVSTLLGSSVNAADLARPAVVYPTTTVGYFTWTGCYVGANVGALWSNIDGNALGADLGTNRASGIAGGVQGGCNYQVGPWVIGLARISHTIIA